MNEQFDFAAALKYLKLGRKVQRIGWNGKGMFLCHFNPVANGLEIINPGYGEFPLLPFILMKTADDKWVPWLASQTDILAEDWQIYNIFLTAIPYIEA